MLAPDTLVCEGYPTALEMWGSHPLSEVELQTLLSQLDEIPDDWDNPFVEEVRAVRQRHAATFGNNLDFICEDIRRNRTNT
jgi:hypothetical protein